MIQILAQDSMIGLGAELIRSGYFAWLLVVGGIVLVSIVKSTARVLQTFARERTRREIAAFIAEGSMTPEQGERLMKAGERLDV